MAVVGDGAGGARHVAAREARPLVYQLLLNIFCHTNIFYSVKNHFGGLHLEAEGVNVPAEGLLDLLGRGVLGIDPGQEAVGEALVGGLGAAQRPGLVHRDRLGDLGLGLLHRGQDGLGRLALVGDRRAVHVLV